MCPWSRAVRRGCIPPRCSFVLRFLSAANNLGRFDALEDEMVLMGSAAMKHSPDRVDALVWAVHDLILKNRINPRVRQL